MPLACFRKICFEEQGFSGTVTILFKKFQITGPLYSKVFLPISDFQYLMMLNWFCMRDDLEVNLFENSSQKE